MITKDNVMEESARGYIEAIHSGVLVWKNVNDFIIHLNNTIELLEKKSHNHNAEYYKKLLKAIEKEVKS